MAFQLPYFYDYPPYFTLQPVEETRRKQSALWQKLILEYCQHYKVYKVFRTGGEDLPIFVNRKINRSLTQEAKTAFLEDLVASGHGLWLDRGQQSCLILWKKLEAWAATIHEWARSSGMQDSVMTVDELSSGDEVRGTELQGVPRELLISALRLLENKGKARIFKGTSEDDDGVRFFA